MAAAPAAGRDIVSFGPVKVLNRVVADHVARWLFAPTPTAESSPRSWGRRRRPRASTAVPASTSSFEGEAASKPKSRLKSAMVGAPPKPERRPRVTVDE